jgi:hypothetical protein
MIYGTFESAQKSGLIGFSCQGGLEGEPWQGQLVVPRDAACGDWRLRELHLADKAGNRADLDTRDPVVGSTRFSVVSSEGRCDSTPPAVRSVSVSPSVVSNAEASEVSVAVEAVDDESGVSSVSGRADGPRPTGGGAAPNIWFTTRTGGQGAPWIGTVSLAPLTAKGTWRIGYLQVADKANNIKYVHLSNDPARC